MDVKLVMFREDGSRRSIPLLAGTTTIGRQNTCTIRIPLAEVSRRHAELSAEADELVLKDLGAANGTYVNNRRIDGAVDIEAGDQIMIGPVVFTVQIDGEPSDGEMIEIRTKISTHQTGKRAASIGTSKHVYTSDEEIDPIAALEALASSADQTAIEPEEDD